MPTSLEHGPKYRCRFFKKKRKYRCRKINRGHHTLEMRTNGKRYDIPNTTHLREKRMRKERVLKSTKPKGKAKLLNLLNTIAWLIYMLAFAPFLLAPRRTCPSSMRLCSMCVHAKAKTRNQQTSNGRKDAKSI